MSFIYAEKYCDFDSGNESVRILCDTKTIPNNYTKPNIPGVAYDMVLKYGMVKSTIFCPELCISFAGNNTIYAPKLFEYLEEIKTFNPEDVSTHALEIHKKASNLNDIEFIITYFLKNQIHIDCVKNGELNKDVTFAHIGSDNAFQDFQRIRLSSGNNAVNQTELAFCDIVNGCSDDSVGGRAIEVIFDYKTNSFIYQWKRAFFSSEPQIVAPGESIIFNTSASDGGYSYEVEHIDIENVLFKIDQMEHAILYSRKYRIDSIDPKKSKVSGLMLPILVELKDDGEVVYYKPANNIDL